MTDLARKLVAYKRIVLRGVWSGACLGAIVGCATPQVAEPLHRVVREGGAGQSVILSNAMPVGVIAPYAGELPIESRIALASQGWLVCDGAAVSRGNFAELYRVLGSSHGAGDGRLTFNLPDYQGRFLRGVSGASARDSQADQRSASASGGNSGNRVGSVQTDSPGFHQHAEVGMMEADSLNMVIGSVDPRPGMVQTQQAAIPGPGQRETRPKNIYVHYLIFAGLQPQ